MPRLYRVNFNTFGTIYVVAGDEIEAAKRVKDYKELDNPKITSMELVAETGAKGLNGLML